MNEFIDIEAPQSLMQSDLAGLAGYMLKRAYMRMHADFRAVVEPFGLTQRTFSVLSLVCENPGVSQSDVARELGIERSGMVVIVDQLETSELVQRNRLESDRRAYALEATGQGRALYAKVVEAIREHEARVLADLSDQEVATLRVLLARVAQVG